MARPPIGVAGHDMATYKGVTYCGQGPLQRGSQLRPGPARKCGARPLTPAKGGSRPWLGHRGCQLWAWRPQEGSMRAEAPPARAATCKCGRSQERPSVGVGPIGAMHVEVPPTGAAPAAGAAAPWQGDCRRARAAVTYSGAAMATGSAMRVTEEG
ncbi:hypothetical protein BHM03_00030963 [Ensete ventricosum]|nr:hypothetical protein BHM03_00030963 [Ensete ventricosum]